MKEAPEASQGPRSFCTCGHTGDGPKSQHDDGRYGSRGHGPCKVDECPCVQFTWDRFIVKRGKNA